MGNSLQGAWLQAFPWNQTRVIEKDERISFASLG